VRRPTPGPIAQGLQALTWNKDIPPLYHRHRRSSTAGHAATRRAHTRTESATLFSLIYFSLFALDAFIPKGERKTLVFIGCAAQLLKCFTH